MNTLTKLALGMLGQLRPKPACGGGGPRIALPPPRTAGGLPLMQALQRRESRRSFAPQPLEPQELSDLLWAAAGVNRTELGGRTAPSALNAQEVSVHAAMADGLYRYLPAEHALERTADTDMRAVTGYQDFVDTAPLDLVYVADLSAASLVPVAQREAYAQVAAGAMAQNVYLFCASAGLATVIRAWLDRSALARAMQLHADQMVLLAQTVGRPGAG